MLKLAKKVLTVGVTFTTLFVSVLGGAFYAFLPTAANADSVCPTLNPGDLIKVKGKPAIYSVNNQSKVLYFPSGDEFKSWNVGENYGGYVTITQPCFDSLQVPATYPGAVNFRPGSGVVKRPSSDQLYVVEPGNMLAKIDPATATALYGNYKVMTVADPFWPHYVNRGPDVTGPAAHPGMLLSYNGKTWYVDGNNLREVTATGMTANRFKAAFVHRATDAMVAGLTTGSQITAEVPAFDDRTQSGGIVAPSPTPTPTSTPVASGNLTVALASDNPFAATIVSDSGTNGAQAMIPVLKLNFTADNSGAAQVNTLVVKRGGISADTDISNMYLYDTSGNLLASNPSISNGNITFSSSAGLFTVAKGTTMPIIVKLDLKNAVSSGKTMSYSVVAAASVTLSNSAASVGGSFPLTGNIFTLAAVTDLGKLAVANVTPTAAGTVNPGTKGFEIWRFSLTNTNQDIQVNRMAITLVGSINVGDLQNFTISDGATQIGTSTPQLNANKQIVFDLSSNPYVVTKGQTKNISLKADIVGGTNRTFFASFQNSYDFVSYDRNYNVFLKTGGTDSFTIIQAGGTSSVNWTVNTGTLTQTLDPTSPINNIAKGGTSITLAKFLWQGNGEPIKVSSLSVSSTASTITDTLANVRLLVNGSQVGTTISSLTLNGASNSGWGTFGNSFIIPVGTNASVSVVADTTGTVTAGDTITVGVSAGSSNAQGTVSLTNISTVAENGNTLTAQSGTVSVLKNVAFGDKSSANPTMTVNATQQKVSSLTITAGSGEDVSVSQIILEDYNVSAGNCIGNTLQNLTLKDINGNQLGQTYPNPSTTCTTRNTYTFNLSPAMVIKNGAQAQVDVFADAKASLATATTLIDVNSITASGVQTGQAASVTPTAQTVPLQLVYVAAAGNMMAQVDPNTPVASNYLMGATNQVLAGFKLSASSTEAVSITKLVVSAYISTGATGTMANIRLVDDATGAQIGTSVPAFGNPANSPATSTIANAVFSNLNLTIPAGISKTVDVQVDFTTYQNGGFSTTGQTIAPTLLVASNASGAVATITANGLSSGTSLTPTIATVGSLNSFGASAGAYSATATLYRAKLTTSWASDTPSGASSPNSAQIVAKFVVTNFANAGSYTATVDQLNLNFATTISNAGASAAPLMSVYKDSLTTTALATTYWSTNGASTGSPITISGSSNITSANFNSNNGVAVSSGASKTFYVTLDTSGAASTKSLSVRVNSGGGGFNGGGITWDDGVSTGITTMGTDLPLLYKTFTY